MAFRLTQNKYPCSSITLRSYIIRFPPLMLWSDSLLLSPIPFIPATLAWPPSCFSNMSGKLAPQDLCTCSLAWMHFHRYPLTSSFTFFVSLFKCTFWWAFPWLPHLQLQPSLQTHSLYSLRFSFFSTYKTVTYNFLSVMFIVCVLW